LMRRFKSAGQAQLFLTVHGVVQNLFRLGRHLLRATNYRLLRDRSFREWSAATRA
jgi:putative transposase